MKILFISLHQCIRTYKEAVPLIERGHQMYSVSSVIGTGFNYYENNSVYWYGTDHRKPQTKEHFKKIVKQAIENTKPDIIHIHNEPDWICTETIPLAKQANIPIVWDLHDVESARWMTIPLEEQMSIKEVDGIVVPSIGCKKWIEKYHWYLKTPIEVFYSCFFDGNKITKIKDVHPRPINDVGHRVGNSIVYEGGLWNPEKKANNGKMNFRDYSKVIDSLSFAGFQCYVYPAGDEENGDLSIYRKFGAIVCDTVPSLMITQELQHYEFGLTGFPITGNPLCDMAMPNKLFDYMYALTIPVVINCTEAGEFVEKNGCGIWIKDKALLENPECLAPLLKLSPEKKNEIRCNIRTTREKYYAENQIDVLINLYERILNERKKITTTAI